MSLLFFFVCLHVEPVLRSEDDVQSGIKIGSVLCLYTPLSLSVPEMEGIYATGDSLCILNLLTSQMEIL